jgi:myb-related protein
VKKVRKSLALESWDKEEPGTQLLTEDISDMQVCKEFIYVFKWLS